MVFKGCQRADLAGKFNINAPNNSRQMQQNDSLPKENEKSSGNHEDNKEQVEEYNQIGKDSIQHLQPGRSLEVTVDRFAMELASVVLLSSSAAANSSKITIFCNL
jgi:hypothetical protein